MQSLVWVEPLITTQLWVLGWQEQPGAPLAPPEQRGGAMDPAV